MTQSLSGQKTLSVGDLDKRIKELEELVETISRSKVMWETTFDTILDPVLIINTNYDIKRANMAFADACSMDIREVINKKCYEVFAGSDKPCRTCPAIMALENKDPQFAELDIFPSSHQYTVNAYASPDIFSENDENIVLHYRDISEEKQLQKKLSHSEKMAAVGTLAGGVAHEINNPLAGILAFVQLALRQISKVEPNVDSLRSDLKEIEHAVLRCKQIVRNLLDFSRHELGDQIENVQLEEVIHRSMTLIKINAKQFDVDVKYNFSPELPSIKGDINKLQQVALNMITNAIHAMKEKGGTLTISTFSDEDNSRACLSFEDTGMGIKKEQVGRIFDPYFTTKDQGEGTGLGLSICYKIIQEHKGRIEVDSDVGKGTTIRLEFPAVSMSV